MTASFLAQIPDAELVRLDANLGFAEGSNVGIRTALTARRATR
jgi:GT2 family glycosyltransferase